MHRPSGLVSFEPVGIGGPPREPYGTRIGQSALDPGDPERSHMSRSPDALPVGGFDAFSTRRVIHAWGEVDISNSRDLDSHVDALRAAGPGDIRVDLGWVTFLDCAVVSSLVRARTLQATTGHELILDGVSPAVERVFRLAGASFLLVPQAGPSPLHFA